MVGTERKRQKEEWSEVMSDIEGKATTVGASERAVNEFQLRSDRK